jgi:hypothetical protein
MAFVSKPTAQLPENYGGQGKPSGESLIERTKARELLESGVARAKKLQAAPLSAQGKSVFLMDSVLASDRESI